MGWIDLALDKANPGLLWGGSYECSGSVTGIGVIDYVAHCWLQRKNPVLWN
jgi:hypothetical protein